LERKKTAWFLKKSSVRLAIHILTLFSTECIFLAGVKKTFFEHSQQYRSLLPSDLHQLTFLKFIFSTVLVLMPDITHARLHFTHF